METMASYGWRKNHSVEEWLLNEPWKFDFFQAVRLLERMHPERTPVGEGSDPRNAVVWFKGKTRLDFPPSDIEKITAPENPREPSRMNVNFMSLSGSLGPLPNSYSEFLIERVWKDDTAMRDFLDIFNHRLISLMYRVKKNYRPGFDNKRAEDGTFSKYLFSLSGLGTPGLRDRMETNDRALMLYTGLFAKQPRSMIGLETILKSYFQAPIRGESFRGRWMYLESDQWTKIGLTGDNRRLGMSAVLGKKIWDQQGKFRIHAGPLSFRQFTELLPNGKGFVPLCEIIWFYTGRELDFDIQMTLNAEEVPESRLSAKSGPRLGWTSWLKTREFINDDSQVVLSPGYLDAPYRVS